MHVGVGGTLVKANAGNVSVAVRSELHPEFQWRVGSSIDSRRRGRTRPNGAWTRLRNCGDCNAWAGNLQIAAVIHRSTLDAQSSRITGCAVKTPILTSRREGPGVSTVQRDLSSSKHAGT